MGNRLISTCVTAQGAIKRALLTSILVAAAMSAGAAPVPMGSASDFAVLGGTTVTNDGASILTGNLGVSPGTAITGFQPAPLNTIVGPGTVTGGLGIVNGTIYPGGPVAAQAHNDAVIAYNYLVAQVPTVDYAGVTQLDGLTFTPGIYRFSPSANLQVNGQLYLDFQGNNDSIFIFELGTTLVTMAGSNIIALNADSQTCVGSNVFWAVGSSATIDGAQFLGTVIANTTITMTSGANVSGRMLALNGAVTMITDTIATCGSGTVPPPPPCRDFVTGGGWIGEGSDCRIHGRGGDHGRRHHQGGDSSKATFAVSGGIKNGQFWGELSFNDYDGMKVRGTGVTAYIVLDAVTRQIEGTAMSNGGESFTYTVVVADNGQSGRNDTFSLELSNGYSASGVLKGGNIQLHKKCGPSHDDHDHDGKENCDDRDEAKGRSDCDNDRDWNR